MLLLILTMALGLRLAGIGFGLPEIFHQDEPIIVNHAVAYASGDLNPHFFKIPPLLSYLLFGWYGILFGILKAASGMTGEGFKDLFLSDPTLFYLSGRVIFGAITGCATVWAVHRWARMLVSPAAALFASAAMAVSYLHVRDSHYIYADIPMVWSMTLCLSALTRGRLTRAAVWGGVAVAFKYIALPVAGPLVVVAYRAGRTLPERMAAVLRSLIILAAVYAILNPYGLLDARFFWKEIHQQAAAEGAAPDIWHHLVYSLFEGFGLIGTLLGAAGILLMVRKRPDHWWAAAFTFGFYVVIVFFSQAYERYAMPILPGLCLGLAFFFEEFSRRGNMPARRIVALLLAAGALLPMAAKSVYLGYLASQEDTRVQAKNWIEEHLPAGEGLVMEHVFFSPRITQSSDQIREKVRYVALDDPHRQQKLEKIGRLAERNAARKSYRLFYVKESSQAAPAFTQATPLIDPDPASWRESHAGYFIRCVRPAGSDRWDGALASGTRKIAVFSPYRASDRRESFDGWAHVGFPFLSQELFSRVRPGPYLEIYRLEGA